MNRRRRRAVAVVVSQVIAGLITFSPCASAQTFQPEVRLDGLGPRPYSVEPGIGAIYAAANIRMEVRHDQSDLPRRESVRLADLHALMTSFQSISAPPGTWKLYVLVATSDANDPDTLGIMFDFGSTDRNDLPREGCAIFAGAHEALPGGVGPEMLLTAAHELAHCFNLHHPDWDGTSFHRDATIESYSLTDSVRWSLSPQSRDHLPVLRQDLFVADLGDEGVEARQGEPFEQDADVGVAAGGPARDVVLRRQGARRSLVLGRGRLLRRRRGLGLLGGRRFRLG